MLKRDKKLIVEDLISQFDDIKIVDIKNLTDFANAFSVTMYKCDINEDHTLEQLAPFSDSNAIALCDAINHSKTEEGQTEVKSYLSTLDNSKLKSFLNTLNRLNQEMLYLYGIATTFQVYTTALQNGKLLSKVEENN